MPTKKLNTGKKTGKPAQPAPTHMTRTKKNLKPKVSNK